MTSCLDCLCNDCKKKNNCQFDPCLNCQPIKTSYGLMDKDKNPIIQCDMFEASGDD